MARKTKTERIDEITLQIQQLENQKRQLEVQERERARKERTKRLIERGAILESIISGADTLTNEQIKAFLEKTVATSYGQKMLDSINPQAVNAADTSTKESPETEG